MTKCEKQQGVSATFLWAPRGQGSIRAQRPRMLTGTAGGGGGRFVAPAVSEDRALQAKRGSEAVSEEPRN